MKRSLALSGATRYANELRKALRLAPPIPSTYALPHDLVTEAERHFLGSTYEEWRSTQLEETYHATDFSDVEYWLDHGRVASELMGCLAQLLGTNPVFYSQMGRLHDIDYLRFPHNAPDPQADVHPVPLARFLSEHDVPIEASVAIMEHAGYIGKGSDFATTLSAALSACDDLATYLAAVPQDDPRYARELCPLAQNLAAEIHPPRVLLNTNRACPTRVLARPELYINSALRKAEFMAKHARDS